jgi:hypothetical protein
MLKRHVNSFVLPRIAYFTVMTQLRIVVDHGIGLVHLLDVLEHVLLPHEGGAAEAALQFHVEGLNVLLEGQPLT